MEQDTTNTRRRTTIRAAIDRQLLQRRLSAARAAVARWTPHDDSISEALTPAGRRAWDRLRADYQLVIADLSARLEAL